MGSNGLRRALTLMLVALPGTGLAAPQRSPATVSAPAFVPAVQARTVSPQPSSAPNRADAETVLILVRTTLVALHQANLTGNYTVLRDLSAPDFHDRNTAADLARIFGGVRDRRIDLAQAVLLDPHITHFGVTPDRILHISGSVAVRPTPVTFDLLFQPIDGSWRTYGIVIRAIQTEH